MSERVRTSDKKSEVKRGDSVPQLLKTKPPHSTSSPVDRILFLQRTIGNQAVQRLINSGVLQAKLRIGKPDDIHEQEADRITEQVMRMPEPQVTKSTAVSSQKLSTRIQRRCLRCIGSLPENKEEEELIHAKEAAGSIPEVPQELESQISGLDGGGQPLPGEVRAFFEPRFGYDFSQVRVHTDAKAAESARAVNALAYAVGQNVVFGASRYAPHTNEGRRLLAHELTHVLQQGQGAIMPTLFTEVADTVMTSSNRVVSGFTHAEPNIQRVCGPAHIGSPGGCIGMGGDIIGEHYLFRVNCDDFKTGEEAKLRAFAATLSSGGSVKIHGFASIEGDSVFNENLSCARAIKVRSVLNSVLIPSGISVSYSLLTHGATAGDREERRSVYIDWLPASPAPSPAPSAPPGCIVSTNPDLSGPAFNPTTDTQEIVALSHPVDALSANGAASDAFAAAGASGLAGPHLGPQDAFRHCVWNCLMTQRIGAARAEQFATGHENSGPSAIPFDNQMDLHDNATGRGLGTPGADCSAACMGAVISGMLRTIRGPHTRPSAVPPVTTDCIGASNQPWP